MKRIERQAEIIQTFLSKSFDKLQVLDEGCDANIVLRQNTHFNQAMQHISDAMAQVAKGLEEWLEEEATPGATIQVASEAPATSHKAAFVASTDVLPVFAEDEDDEDDKPVKACLCGKPITNHGGFCAKCYARSLEG